MAERPKLLTFPLASWNTAVADNGEPVLVIDLTDGNRVSVMMPSQAASEMGRALQDVAERTAPPALRN